MGPLLSINKARCVLGQLKGCRKISYEAIVNLVKKEGLPKHDNPFTPGTWCFVESELVAWFEARMTGAGKPMRGPGRPPKSSPLIRSCGSPSASASSNCLKI